MAAGCRIRRAAHDSFNLRAPKGPCSTQTSLGIRHGMITTWAPRPSRPGLEVRPRPGAGWPMTRLGRLSECLRGGQSLSAPDSVRLSKAVMIVLGTGSHPRPA